MYILSDFIAEKHEPRVFFSLEMAYINLQTIKKILASLNSVSNIRSLRPFPLFGDGIHVQFDYHNVPFIVEEPWGDSNEHWIIPANFVDDGGITPDISEIKNAFRQYKFNLCKRCNKMFFNIFYKNSNIHQENVDKNNTESIAQETIVDATAITVEFFIEKVFIDLFTIYKILMSIDTVYNINYYPALLLRCNGLIEFDYRNTRFVVETMMENCSRWCVRQLDISSDKTAIDISELKNAFQKYKPNLIRRIFGYVVTLRFLKKGGWKSTE